MCLRLIFISIFSYSAMFLHAQLESDDFNPRAKELIQKVDQADFESARKLLAGWDTSSHQSHPERQAEYQFAKGYLTLFTTGGQESFDLFSAAATSYDQLGNLSKRNYCEVYQLVNIYLMDRWPESKKMGAVLLEKIPAEEEESRAIVHNILAAAYGGTEENFEKTQYHAQKAIDFFIQHKNSRRLTSLYGILAASYNNRGDYESAIQHIDSAALHASRLNNLQQEAFLKLRKGRALFNANRNDAGVKSIQSAIDYYIQNPSELGQLQWAYGLLSLHYADQADYKNAYLYRRKSETLSAQVRTEENDAAINKIMVQYETEKKDRQLEIQALTLAAERQKFQSFLTLGISSFGILVLAFFLIYNQYKNRQQEKSNAKEMEFQRTLLETTISTQESERKRIARDLHDGIGQQLSGLKFSLEQYNRNNNSQNGLSTYIDKLQDASNEVRHLSHQMMPKALHTLGLKAALFDVMEKTFEDSPIKINFETIGLHERLPEKISVGAYRIVQELINNIIKHSNATEVELQIRKSAHKLVLILEENGMGFQVDPSGNKGHGVSNMQTRAQVLNGKISFDRGINGGMLTTLTIPLINIPT